MTGWAMFFMLLGVAAVDALPLRIVERIERK